MATEKSGHWEGSHEDFGLVAGYPGDQAIAVGVKDLIAWDDALREADIRVHVRNGVVILQGSVPTEELRNRVQQMADGLPSVAGVENRLRVGKEAARGE